MVAGLVLARRTSPPREHDALRNDGFRGQHSLDVEFEADAALVRLRQARDHALDPDVPALPFGRQRVGEAQPGHQRRPREAGGEARCQHESPLSVGQN